MKSFQTATRIWAITNALTDLGWLLFIIVNQSLPIFSLFFIVLITAIVSLPALIAMMLALRSISKGTGTLSQKKYQLILVCVACCLGYYFLAGTFIGFHEPFLAVAAAALIGSSLIAVALSANQINSFFLISHSFTIQPNHQMEPSLNPAATPVADKSRSNKIVMKLAITGVLILVMLIPTLFITNLVREREQRQAEVVTEVSQRWAEAQVLTGPYIHLPYKKLSYDKDKKVIEELEYLTLLPDNLEVSGDISHELRERSIYKVLLYRAAIRNSGNYQFQLPKDIDSSLVQWQDTKICYGISDFKGIEERMVINFKGVDYELSPGLPSANIHQKGLSAPVSLSLSDVGSKLPFRINVKIKGSEQLHFVPLSGDSRFTLRSTWPDPSFDGNNLPSERNVFDSGFTATWKFNKANLPFNTTLRDFAYNQNDYVFGVTLIQPADGYAKTNRCIKYAILIIGLTFSLFFIIELMQKKPVHPVQYILIGLGLVIFYTLLLSISEFLKFDLAYLVAAIATITLISAYAFGHFKSYQTTGIFGGALMSLYGFIFILIRLEDTALLLGSIGLFIILALAMYASRKINWYGEDIKTVSGKIAGTVG